MSLRPPYKDKLGGNMDARIASAQKSVVKPSGIRSSNMNTPGAKIGRGASNIQMSASTFSAQPSLMDRWDKATGLLTGGASIKGNVFGEGGRITRPGQTPQTEEVVPDAMTGIYSAPDEGLQREWEAQAMSDYYGLGEFNAGDEDLVVPGAAAAVASFTASGPVASIDPFSGEIPGVTSRARNVDPFRKTV